MRANIVASVDSVVLIGGIRCGLVRRTRFGASPEAAVAHLWQELPVCDGNRLVVVDAGIATKEQLTLASAENALMGRLRRNAKLRMSPPQRTGKRGRPLKHGAVLHPGDAEPERAADEEVSVEGESGSLRLRRWSEVHYEEYPATVFDVVRVDDPKYDKPLLIGSTARELSTAEFLSGYKMRSTIETNFYVAQERLCDGDAARLYGTSRDEKNQLGVVIWLVAQSHRRAVRSRRSRSVGSKTATHRRTSGTLAKPTRREFCGFSS